MALIITVAGLDPLVARLASIRPVYQGAVRTFLTRSALAVQGEAQQRTPAAGFNTVKYSTGTLRRSMTNMVDPAPFATYAKIGTALPYGHFIEEGFRNDPRFGTVRRKAGPANMLRDGLRAALPRIQGFAQQMVAEVAAALRG